MGAPLRLNLFQRAMLRWRDLHPYNPVHVICVPTALEPARLRACITERLEQIGLAGLAVDRSRRRVRYPSGPVAVDLTVVDAEGDASAALCRLIEREFNRPFVADRVENPIRFFAIDEGNAFRLALVYDHFVASGDSIARLLTAIASCAGMPQRTWPPLVLQHAPATYRNLLLRHPLWALRAALALPRMIAGARRAYRPRYADVEDGANAYRELRIDAPQAAALRAAAKAWDVTLNELLMAAMLLALSPHALDRRREPRRSELALASILNMRRDFGPDAQDALNPFLAAFRVSHAVPDGMALSELALEVHAQAARVKRGHLYLQSLIALGVSALLWPMLSLRRRHAFFPKYFAVWAGITSLDVDALWARSADAGCEGLDYLRAVPTGPLCPVVFAVTAARGALNVGIAYRTAAFSRPALERLAADFMRAIASARAESGA